MTISLMKRSTKRSRVHTSQSVPEDENRRHYQKKSTRKAQSDPLNFKRPKRFPVDDRPSHEAASPFSIDQVLVPGCSRSDIEVPRESMNEGLPRMCIPMSSRSPVADLITSV